MRNREVVRITPPRILYSLFSILAFSILYSCSSPSSKNVPVLGQRLTIVDRIAPSEEWLTMIYRLDTLFEGKMSRGFNGNVLISRRNEVIFRKCFGYSNFETMDSLKFDTPFHVASVSKVFTAVAVLRMYERGELNLTDKVTKYIPEFPYPEITIRMLLTHTSGLSEYNYFCESMFNDPDSPIDNDELLCKMCEEIPAPYYKPGKNFDYCNTNYVLLARIVELVSGQRFDQYMKKDIFDPLEMQDTFISGFYDDSTRKDRAIGYGSKDEKPVKRNLLDGPVGDKNLYISVGDMHKFDKALYTGKLLSDSVLKMAHSPQSKNRKDLRNYGMGWRLIQSEDGTVPYVFHNGWWHGFNASYFHRFSDSTTIIVFGNKFSKEVYRIWSIIDVIDNRMPVDTLSAEEEPGQE
jgi:CubicO group peptidase (beta-lactamase class C family)